MATRSDSGESIEQEPQTHEVTSISPVDSSEESLKIVSLPSIEADSVEEMIPKKQSNSSSVSEKDGEFTHSSSSVEVSFSETASKETDAMDVECSGVVSVPETDSTALEVERVGEEQIEETIAAEISELSTEGDVHKIEEVDGSVVSISEKKEQDSDAQRLLEAEKRRLLAEIEVGTIFKKRVDVEPVRVVKNGDGSKETKMETVRVKDNTFVGRSMKIELVDDTALLNVVSFNKKVKDHAKRPGTSHTDKDAPRKHKKVGEKPNGGKQDKGNALTKVSEFRNLGETCGKKLRIMYSRKQMESMRYANIANQKKLWSDMYARLLPELVAEYEGLVSLKNQKTSKSYQRENDFGILGTEEATEDETIQEDDVVEEDNTDDYNSILRPAFAVDGEPDFDSGPPEDGFEYLRRVRWEAKRVPNVIVAKIDESNYIKKEQSVYMPQIPEIPKCSEHLLPVKEWEDSLLSDFLHLRLALSENDNKCEDEILSAQSVEYMLMGIFNKRLQTEGDESFGGMVSEIQGMDSVTRVSRLKKRIGLVEKESRLESSDCKWVVALCASVDTPLDADTCACLRALLRKCASLRAEEKSSEVEDEQVIIMANMLITITGKYFGQMD